MQQNNPQSRPAMCISGVIVHARPDKLASLKQQISHLPGVEIHADTQDGRLVVTIEQVDHIKPYETLSTLNDFNGIISSSLVFHYDEQTSTHV